MSDIFYPGYSLGKPFTFPTQDTTAIIELLSDACPDWSFYDINDAI